MNDPKAAAATDFILSFFSLLHTLSLSSLLSATFCGAGRPCTPSCQSWNCPSPTACDPTACSNQDGSYENSNVLSCQCGSQTCHAKTGLYCRLYNGGCSGPPPCPAATYSATGSAPCSNCDPGQYTDLVGSTSCKNCEPPTSYQDETGATSCKTCASPQVPTKAGDACTTCAVLLGPLSYLDANNYCQHCQGCAAGSFKTSSAVSPADPQGCDVSCASCPSGYYKDAKAGSEASSQGQEGAWDAPCQQCAQCLVPNQNTFRPTR